MSKSQITESVSDFQIISATVLELTIHNSFAEYSEKMPADKTYDLSYEFLQISKNDDASTWQGVLDQHIQLKCDGEQGNFNAKLTIRGFFRASSGMKKTAFRKMVQINGNSALYSIARGVISSVSAQVFSLGNVVLPMVNFVRFHEYKPDNPGKKNNDEK